MGKFCFPSCSCFSSSSPPQQPANAGASTQPSQQPAIAGPSTPSSSSQPSQQSANAGPSTATNPELEIFLQKFKDISELGDLIEFIEELLKIATGENSEKGSSSAVSSYIKDGQFILELVDKHTDKLLEKKESIDGVCAETEKVLVNFLKGAGKIHWVGAAFSVVGFVLARYSEMSNNRAECLEILKVMVNLGKQILDLNDQMPDQKKKLNEAVELIVAGCTMCTSQFASTKIFRFLTASVNADSLKAFQVKIDRLYDDLQLSGIVDIQKRLPKIAPQSQEIYSYKPAVGIQNAKEEVIRLLDLNAQHTSPQVVVVHGFGGIGKTTLADAVYANIDLQSYKHCRIQMDQNCTKNDLKVLQEQILNGLFHQNLKLTDCAYGRGMICSYFKKNPNQPLFLYIDNGLKNTDLKELLPEDLGSCLPQKSRILVTTRNLHETDIFLGRNVQRQPYPVSPLPQTEAREILLKKVPDYNDEKNISDLLKLCDGVPLLLELAGSQLAISSTNTNNNIVLELLRAGERVEEEDISDRMVDFVYSRLLQPVQQAFLDIASFPAFQGNPPDFYSSQYVAKIVGEEEFRALEDASLVKTSEIDPSRLIVHDIVRTRGKKMSEQNRITDPESLLDCLDDKEKLQNLKGIFFNENFEQPPIKINENHLKCMSNSLRVLSYEGSQITFTEKCHKSFKQLRFLCVSKHLEDLPMEFEKLERLVYYCGPFTQGMSLYEFPPSLHSMIGTDSSENRVEYSKIPPKVTPASLLEQLQLYSFKNMERLPDGVEKLTKLEKLHLCNFHQLRELPSKLGDLRNLKVLSLTRCDELEELPSSLGQFSNLTNLCLHGCSALSVLPSSLGQLKHLEALDLRNCSGLKELLLDFGQLKHLEALDLSNCSGLKELPLDFGQLKNLKVLDLDNCSGLEEWPLSFRDLTQMKYLFWSGCSSKLKELLPNNIRENCRLG